MYDNPDDDDYRDRDLATPKQLKFLRKLGVAHAEDISLDDASDLIDEALKRQDRGRRNRLLAGILIALVAILIVYTLSQTK